jgi:tryptophan 2,3-dioxygenase
MPQCPVSDPLFLRRFPEHVTTTFVRVHDIRKPEVGSGSEKETRHVRSTAAGRAAVGRREAQCDDGATALSARFSTGDLTMTPSSFLSSLSGFDVRAYEERVQSSGRSCLAHDQLLVSQVTELAEKAAALRDNWSIARDRSLSAVVEISRCFLAAQAYVLSHEKPRYEPYAGIALLRSLLGVDSHQPLSVTQRRIWTVFRLTVEAHIDFEVRAISGLLEPRRRDFDSAVSRERVKLLQSALAKIPPKFRMTVVSGGEEASSTLADIAADRTGGAVVRHLLVFPQTTCHDETAFIRLIQMAECLFWGTLIFVQRALSAVHARRFSDADRLLCSASEFAAPLIKVFHAVRAMPPAHFLGFREATGDASAIQCWSWQMLDAHVYGVLPEKAPILATIPEVRPVLALANPTFVPLIRVLEELTCTEDEETLASTIIELDHRIAAWRRFHEKQLAGQTDPGYLPPEALGTGGTSGYGYLAAQRPPRAAAVWRQRRAEPPTQEAI